MVLPAPEVPPLAFVAFVPDDEPPGAGLRLRFFLLSAALGFEEDATGWSFFLNTGSSILPIIFGPLSCLAFARITSSSSSPSTITLSTFASVAEATTVWAVGCSIEIASSTFFSTG